jgi:malate dehydrogenase (oxaloacetate-decarboxylating)
MVGLKQQTLKLHLKYHGKLAVKSKVRVKNKLDLSLAYTPGVAEVCREVAKNKKKAFDYTIKKNTVAVVTDGSAVLGLGNIGPEAALPVMEGKALLFKEFANVDAWPICLDTQDAEEIIKTIKLIAPGFGGINLEDISAPRCFEVEEKLKRELDIPVFHDDQHGTAIIVLAGLINALKVAGKKIGRIKVVVNGAGAAGVAISKLLLLAGVKSLYLLDSKGVIYQGRKNLNSFKKKLAKQINLKYKGNKSDLEEAIIGTDVFVGVSKANLVTAKMVKSMNNKPIIFAMANPIPEIMPNLAKKAGAAIVATGRSDFANQLNNVLVFPGIFRGALDNGVKQITDQMKLRAAKALAGLIKKPTAQKIIPDVFDKRVVKAISRVIK